MRRNTCRWQFSDIALRDSRELSQQDLLVGTNAESVKAHYQLAIAQKTAACQASLHDPIIPLGIGDGLAVSRRMRAGRSASNYANLLYILDIFTMSLPQFYSFTKQWHSKPYDAISLARPEMSAAGKNVVVTGAGSGVGKAIAIAFARAGASSVALLGRRLERLETTAASLSAIAPKVTVLCKSTDVSDRLQVEKAFSEIVSGVGKPHILINNAGVLPDPCPIAQAEDEVLQQTFSINVFGALIAAQVFLEHASTEPILLNINSGISHMAPLRSMGLYAASKAANAKIFDYLALEHPDLHLVNVQPGVVNTEMNRRNMVKTQDEPELPAQFCVWLASPEAKFLRGKFVWVNWDVEELKDRAEEIANSRLLTTLLDGVPM